jgi:peroxiredoxin
MKTLVRPLALVAVSLGMLAVAPAGLPTAPQASAPMIGAPAPAFALTTVDGKPVTLVSLRGKTLVINVWGSWCPPCRLETPDLVEEANAMRPQGVAFLGIDTTETAAVVRAYVAAKGIPFPEVVASSDSAFAKAYRITNYPTTFVIDPHGILRAIHADNILPRAQLHAYILAAQKGETAPLESAEQAKLDGLLAPGQFPFDGDPTTVLANAHAAEHAIEAADAELDDAMNDPSRDHDLLRTRDEEASLRERTIVALGANLQSDADRALLARLRGDAAVAHGRWQDAQETYDAALAIAPNDTSALSGLAYTFGKIGNDSGVAQVDEKITVIEPSYSSFVALARADAKIGAHAAALAALDRAIALAQARIAAKPDDRSRYAGLAWTHLYGGRAAVQLGDRVRARTEFTNAAAAAAMIPKSDAHYTWYLEQAQEATVALGLGAASDTSISLAPWTGADLPGSVESTFKYRVAVTGVPGATVALRASGLPKAWIASFCTDRVCAPFHVVTTIPNSGVRVIEFQVIPDGPKIATTPTVRIVAMSGHTTMSASAMVH